MDDGVMAMSTMVERVLVQGRHLSAYIADCYMHEDRAMFHLTLLLGGLAPLLLYSYLVFHTEHSRVIGRKGSVDVLLDTRGRNSTISSSFNEELGGSGDAVSAKLGGIKSQAARDRVVQDFISQDSRYLAKLSILRDKYMHPLMARKILSHDDVASQFLNLDEMIALHSQLRSQMKKVNNHGGTPLLAKTLLRFAKHLSIYEAYMHNWEMAQIQRGNILCVNTRYATFLEQESTFHDEFEALLAEPINRMHILIGLFTKLAEATPETHPDRAEAVAAVACVSKLYMHRAHHGVTWEKRLEVMKIIASMSASTRINLLDNPARTLIRTGTLLKQCRKAIKPFRFWLFSDKLIYAEETKKIGITTRSVYILHREIELVSSRISEKAVAEVNKEYEKRALLIEYPAKSFVVYVPNVVECEEWLRDIKECTEHVRQDMECTGIIAPLWIPDLEAVQCGLCRTTFTMIKRRHHCRSCGRVVCGHCSARKFLLAHVDASREVRTCDECFGNLSAKNSPHKDGADVHIRGKTQSGKMSSPYDGGK